MSENIDQGVGVRKADLDFDKGRPENDEDENVDEQRRQFALGFAAGTATDIDALLANAKRIEDFLKGSVVDKS